MEKSFGCLFPRLEIKNQSKDRGIERIKQNINKN